MSTAPALREPRSWPSASLLLPPSCVFAPPRNTSQAVSSPVARDFACEVPCCRVELGDWDMLADAVQGS